MTRRQSLPRRVQTYILDRDLIRPGESLVVGVSGGPDSMCLLHIMAGLRKALEVRLHVAHLNHLLRGAESDSDAEYVSAASRRMGLPATIDKRDARAYQREHGLSLEEAAREVRYSFFSEVARAEKAETVAVGHTADDQVETILMHLVRGTGLAGLRGMQPLGTWSSPDEGTVRIVRPLLEVRRQETEAYCAAHRLSPREDSSNLRPEQLRNRIRSELIPLLRSYNPNVDEAVLRAARAAEDDLALIDEEASRLWGSAASENPDGVALDRAEFARLRPALKRHLVRAAIGHLLGDLRDVESTHIESLLDAMAKPAGKSLSLPRGLAFRGGYGEGLVTATGDASSPLPEIDGERRLNIPGCTELPGWQVDSTVLDHQPTENVRAELTALLDLDVTGTELTVRPRKRGDRFQPLGMEDTKKLQDFMVDAKIPRHWRDSVPLVCSPQHILWVVGWRIDHRARVTSSTKKALRLRFERT
jgi:tRNA(Ile)-lysidine synthase